jgi:hypothetical protein
MLQLAIGIQCYNTNFFLALIGIERGDKLNPTRYPQVLHHGVSKEVAEKFGVPRLVVQRIWHSG